MQIAREFGRIVVDFALPHRCPGCASIVHDSAGFCGGCWSKLLFLTEPCCASCDLPLPFAAGRSQQCAACLDRSPLHDGIKAVLAYDDVSRSVALKLKYGGRIALARLIAGLLARHLSAAPQNARLVPVPLHWTRLWSRSFNQSALIASSLSHRTGMAHVPDALVRKIKTPPLAGLTAKERSSVLRNAFAINPRRKQAIEGMHVYLVDDVYTSGATTDACVKVLKKNGAVAVTIMCWARVLPAGISDWRGKALD